MRGPATSGASKGMTGTQDTELVLINEAFYAERVEADQLDYLLENGWRHFGERFQRYSLNYYKDEIRRVIPLRIRLSGFNLTKSQRRTLKRNEDVTVEFRPTLVTPDIHDLFELHSSRFTQDIPHSVYTFLSYQPSYVPTDGMMLRVSLGNDLVAASFFEMSTHGLSSIYAMFNPGHSDRRLGIYTMLKEIQYAQHHGRGYYYHGYAYEGESFYDYKKRFTGLEAFDWKERWTPYR